MTATKPQTRPGRSASSRAFTHRGVPWTWGTVAAVYVVDGGLSHDAAALLTDLSRQEVRGAVSTYRRRASKLRTRHD